MVTNDNQWIYDKAARFFQEKRECFKKHKGTAQFLPREERGSLAMA
jgi:hypothetical protein